MIAIALPMRTQGEQGGQEDRQDFRHEGKGHFLHLSERLQQGDRDPDHERDQHDRRAELDQHEDRLACDVEDLVCCHRSILSRPGSDRHA
jgi:hypothetical protein